MANDYFNVLISLKRSDIPDVPINGSSLIDFLNNANEKGLALNFGGRQNLILFQLFELLRTYPITTLAFLRLPYAVLEESAISEALHAIRKLLKEATESPDFVVKAFPTKYMDGSIHYFTEKDQVVKSIETSSVVKPPDSIFTEYEDLTSMFTFLKSMMAFFEDALDNKKSVVFIRLVEFFKA